MKEIKEIKKFNFNQDMNLETAIDESGNIWFFAKAIMNHLGYSNIAQAIRSHVSILDVKKEYVASKSSNQLLINESGLNALILASSKPEAKDFKRWVTSDVLPSIRKTGSYVHQESFVIRLPTLAAAEVFESYHKVLTIMGISKNAAIISANQATANDTGINFLERTGHLHLLAPVQELTFTPTELGKMVGISAMKLNIALRDADLQQKISTAWNPTDAAKGLYEILDTGKKGREGTPIKQVKWYKKVLEKINLTEKIAA